MSISPIKLLLLGLGIKKPRLVKLKHGAGWMCTGRHCGGLGATPKKAYERWYDQMMNDVKERYKEPKL